MLIKKPVLSAMTLRSLLGDRRCRVWGDVGVEEEVGAIATVRGGDQVAVLLYHFRSESTEPTEESRRITLNLQGVPFGQGRLVHYRIEESHGNPYRVWQQMGEPTHPSAEQFAAMRQHQELTLLEEPRDVARGNEAFSLTPGLTDKGELLLSWSGLDS